MVALYTKYKENGLTVGEIVKKTAKPKPADAPVELGFVSSFNERLDKLEIARLAVEQKSALTQELVMLRGIINQKMKLLKV